MKLKRFLTGVLSAVMALSVCALPALADDANTTTTAPSTSTIDTGKKGSITIHKYLVEGDVTGSSNYGEKLTDKPAYEAAKDVGFSIYQVMTAKELVAYYNGKDNTEPKASDYKIDAADKTKVTKDSKEYKRSRGEQKTDATGVTTFDQLEVGLYLVVETTKPAAVTEAVAPFLVSVPMTRVGEDGKTAPTEWLYDIHVYPKNSTQTGTIYLKKQGLVGGTEISNPTDLNGVQFKLERLKEGKNVGDTDAWEIVTSEKNNNGIYTTDTVEENKSGTIKVDGLHPGTYRFTEVGYADSAAGVDKKYILDTAASYTFKIEAGDEGTQKVTQLDTDNKDYTINGTTITVTNYAPDVDKQVVNRTDGNTYQEAADYAVGDKIPYRIAVTIPTNIAKLKTFYLTDTPENLDDDTRIQFYSNSDCKALITKSLVKETAGITSTNNAKGKGFKIDFDPAKLEEYAGKTIYITYEATLKKGADTTTAGNHNKVDLTYSNKIKSGNVLEDETADHNHIEDTAVVYTFQIDITKVGKDGNNETPLDGVTFKLYEQIAHQTETGEKVLSDDDAKALGFKDTNKFSYKEVATGTTEGGGKLTFTGLSNSKTATTGASRYWLVETQTKEGYNLLGAPVEAKLDIVYKTTWKEKNTFDKGVLVKHSHDANTETFKTPNDGSQTNNGTQEGTEQSAGLDRGEKVTYGILSTKIINKKGFQLPVTGGFGTLLFSGIGVLLVLAGVAVLFSMKKKNDRA
ncbi:SpaH/EbpB family LPXTG-anchored major pilin [uncultured Gemmiger sp.]|uniref:SpaH/EbpB family LPXTG-anchored major pilin n=1 Tax=uncultured Gemmiger sp. TaxID=1623490 RepID=UPI00266B41A2|nr:SpaH/EbpB family LPXTG-anchored major pilin [uncultured Gemmiger sp.]